MKEQFESKSQPPTRKLKRLITVIKDNERTI